MEPDNLGSGSIVHGMMRRGSFKQNRKGLKFLALVAVVALVAAVRASSGQRGGGSLLLTMDRVMTSAELRSTGVASLTPVQRAALDKWLNAYSARVIRIGENQACRDWERGSLESVSDGGELLSTLSGHVFDVEETDRIDTQLWLAPADILYHCSVKDCTIINLDNNGEIVEAAMLK
jgi:hypothetical protein